MRTEITQADYSKENYGDGSAPERPTVIISNKSGNGITAGKEYRVVSHRAYVYIVLNDNGHERVFSMYSSTHAHCNHYSNFLPPMARVFVDADS